MEELNNNTSVFFSLLQAGLWPGSEKQVSVDGAVDWEEIYRLASEQSVLGLVLAGIDGLPNDQKPPKMLLLQWIGEIQIVEQQNKEMNDFIGELVDKMRREGIYTLLVKGQGVGQCYEQPLWRSSGDVDFLLSEDNYNKAKAFLTPLASNVESERQYGRHLGMTIDNWVVELHGLLGSGLSKRIDRQIDEVQNAVFFGGDVRSWMNGKTQVFLPGVDCDVLFVFTHFLKHFYKEGLGLRQLCDWSRLLWIYRDTINHGLLESRLRKMGLMSEWKAFGAFAVDYLGMPSEAMPFYSPDAKWRRKADRICTFIMEVGNMGHKRDGSYLGKYPYVIRKAMSLGRRCSDLIHHSMIFPMDSLRFFPRIMFNGVRSAIRGE
jgi:hypothetical protein